MKLSPDKFQINTNNYQFQISNSNWKLDIGKVPLPNGKWILEISAPRSGQSLVEVVIALGVVVVLAVSLLSASLVTQRSARSAKNNTQATKLVQQSIENLRIFRDRQGFVALANANCWVLTNTSDTNVGNWKLANTLSTPATPCPESILLAETTFTRSIAIENGANSNQKKVTVVVTWVESGGTLTITNVTNLSNCVTTSVAC